MCPQQNSKEHTMSDELNFDFLLDTFSDDIDTMLLDDLDASSACEQSGKSSPSGNADIEELLQIDLDTLVDLTKPLIGSQRPGRIPRFFTTSTQFSFTSHHQSELSAPTNPCGLQASSAQTATPGSTRQLDVVSEQRISQRPPKRARSQISSSGTMPQTALKCQQQPWFQYTNTGEVREVDYTCSYCSHVKHHPEMETVRMQCECGGQFKDNTPRSHNCWIPSADLDINDSMQQPCRSKFTWVDLKVVKPPHAVPSAAVKFKFSPVSNSEAISGKSLSKHHAKWDLNHAKVSLSAACV